MPLHERLSASDAANWFVCPGKIRMCEGLADVPGEAAQRGTAAHTLGETCLERWHEPHQYLGVHIAADVGTKYERSFKVDAAMADGVAVYVALVNRLAPYAEIQAGTVTRHLEKKLLLPWIADELGGTSDCRILDRRTATLHVLDYKNGRIGVEPKRNPQLLIYALGAAHGMDGTQVKTVTLWIVQPNGEGKAEKEWSLSLAELRAWGAEVLLPACARAADPNAPLFATTKACHWCRAKATGECPEVTQMAAATARTSFLEPIFPKGEDLTAEQMEKVAETVELWGAWAKQVKALMLQKAETGAVTFQNFKLIRGRSNRRMNAQAAAVLTEHLGSAAYTSKLIAIGAAEKELKARGFDARTIMAGITDKPEAPLSLVPRTNKGEEVLPATNRAFIANARVFS